MIGYAFNMLNVSYDKKVSYVKWHKEETERRIFTGQTTKMTMGMHDRKALKEEKLRERYEYESKR